MLRPANLRRFYEVFLGIETPQTSPISLMIRLCREHVYAVVQVKNNAKMPRYFHNGLDVETVEDVDSAHETAVAQAEIWGLTDISRPVEQHGTYSFKFWDMDDNCWEILSNPPRGYNWILNRATSRAADISKVAFRKNVRTWPAAKTKRTAWNSAYSIT